MKCIATAVALLTLAASAAAGTCDAPVQLSTATSMLTVMTSMNTKLADISAKVATFQAGMSVSAGKTTLKGKVELDNPAVKHGAIWSGSIGEPSTKWWALARIPKLKNSGYHANKFTMKIATSENSGFSVYNMYGFWVDRSDHSSGHGDFNGFSVSNAGDAGDCAHTHSCDVAFSLSNCGITNGDMYLLAGKVKYNTGRGLTVLDMWRPSNTATAWEWKPTNVPAACKTWSGGPKTLAGAGRRRTMEVALEQATEVAELKSQVKNMEARFEALEAK